MDHQIQLIGEWLMLGTCTERVAAELTRKITESNKEAASDPYDDGVIAGLQQALLVLDAIHDERKAAA